MIPDSVLIDRIKESADNAATLELITRHSGVYIDVINQYAFSPKIQVPELRDDKTFNLYSWALTYDPTKETQFGSYVGKKTRWMCLNILNRDAQSVEMDVNAPNTDLDTQGNADRNTELGEINTEVGKIKDPLFWRIFKLRFNEKKPLSWRALAPRVGMSYEGARKHFIKHIGVVKEAMAT